MKRLKKVWIYWPEALALLVCAVLLSLGISEKQGYHMDELLSFELSNGEFNPWIVPTQPQGRLAKFVEQEIRNGEKSQLANWAETAADVVSNRGRSKLLSYKADVYEEPVWISADQFHEYITVNGEDAFNYLSVYFNVKDDNHPPLHFMLLHTVSSIFQGGISPWMGCSINLFFVLGVMVLLMRLGRQCMTILEYPEWGRYAGMAAALFYGLSMGALSTTLLIRMYAMVTFFCIATLSVHLDKLFGTKLDTFDFREHNCCLVLITVLGFWTQYFFLFYCLTLAAVTAFLLLRQKRSRELVAYIRNMLVAAIVGVALFPFAISDVFSSERGVEALENLATGLSGYGERIAAFLKIWVENTGWILTFYLLAVILLLAFWGRRSGKLGKSKESEKREDGRKYLWAVLLIPAAGYFLLAARMSPYLVDRYIMPLFPLGVLILVIITCSLLGRVEFENRVKKSILLGSIALLACLQLFLPGRGDNPYFYKEYARQEEIAARYGEYPCICVYEGVGYYENLPEFTGYQKTLLVTAEELKDRKERESVEELDTVVVLLKKKAALQETEAALRDYGLHCRETLWESEDPYGDTILLFEK